MEWRLPGSRQEADERLQRRLRWRRGRAGHRRGERATDGLRGCFGARGGEALPGRRWPVECGGAALGSYESLPMLMLILYI